jgi:hypothetical protein
VAIVSVLAIRRDGWPGVAGGPERETALADTGAFTYRDYVAGTTLVWLSYPAEGDSADEDATGMLD